MPRMDAFSPALPGQACSGYLFAGRNNLSPTRKRATKPLTSLALRASMTQHAYAATPR